MYLAKPKGALQQQVLQLCAGQGSQAEGCTVAVVQLQDFNLVPMPLQPMLQAVEVLRPAIKVDAACCCCFRAWGPCKLARS